jgi:G3E family GTPase
VKFFDARREAVPEFVLLTGSLGSGKTTLLSDYLSVPESADTGVIVNEAGEINVDGAIMVSGRRDLPITLLNNGCVCCSGGDDLHAAIDELLSVRRRSRSAGFRRIVLETSGLAVPGPILRSLMAYDRAEYRLRIVSTLDPLNPIADETMLSIRSAQLTAAHSIVFTKLDIADRESCAELERIAASHNPMAHRIVVADRQERARSAFADSHAESARSPSPFYATPVAAHARLQVYLAKWHDSISWTDLRDWLEDLAGFCGDRLLRVKGFVSLIDVPDEVLIDGVGAVFSQPRRVRLDSEVGRGLVIIVRDVGFEELVAFSATSIVEQRPELKHSSNRTA